MAALATPTADAAARQSRPAPTTEATAPREAGEPILAIVPIMSQQVTFYDADGWILRAPVSNIPQDVLDRIAPVRGRHIAYRRRRRRCWRSWRRNSFLDQHHNRCGLRCLRLCCGYHRATRGRTMAQEARELICMITSGTDLRLALLLQMG